MRQPSDAARGRQSFLAEAVAATSRELRIESIEQLARSTRSGVVEFPEGMQISFALPRAVAGVGCAVSIAALLATLLAIGWNLARPMGWPMFLAFVGGALLTAFAVPIFATVVERRAIDSIARKRHAPQGFLQPEAVGIEPAATYNKFKVTLADDLGMLYHDRASRRLLIDGLAHRYLICDGDIERISLGSVKLGTGVRFDVRIGSGHVLQIVLSSRQLSDMTNHSNDEPFDGRVSFANHLCATLRREVEATPE